MSSQIVGRFGGPVGHQGCYTDVQVWESIQPEFGIGPVRREAMAVNLVVVWNNLSIDKSSTDFNTCK